MATTYGVFIMIFGAGLIGLGVLGVLMAMSTPVQLQPIPLIVGIIGLIVFGIGLLVVYGTGPIMPG